jgi:hypothetical protein
MIFGHLRASFDDDHLVHILLGLIGKLSSSLARGPLGEHLYLQTDHTAPNTWNSTFEYHFSTKIH